MSLLSLTWDQLILLSHPLPEGLCLSSSYSSLPLGQSASLFYGTSTEVDSGPALAPQDSEAEPHPHQPAAALLLVQSKHTLTTG